MAGWEATSSLSAVPSFFSLYSSGIFALYFFAQFVFSQVWNKKQPNWWCLVMVNWSFLIYSMIAAPCTCIEQTYHFCFSKSYKSILHSSCGAFLFTLWEDWYLSLVIIRNIDSMFIYIYCCHIVWKLTLADHRNCFTLWLGSTLAGPSLTPSTSASSPSPPSASATSSRVFFCFLRNTAWRWN